MRNKDISLFEFNVALDRLGEVVDDLYNKKKLKEIEDSKRMEAFGLRACAYMSLHIEKPEEFDGDYIISMLTAEYKGLKLEEGAIL